MKAIGQAAIKIEEGAERCVNVLLDLIATRVSYVVQEAVVVMKVHPPWCVSRLCSDPGFRIFSGSTHHSTRVSYRRCAPIWTNSMNQKPRLH